MHPSQKNTRIMAYTPLLIAVPEPCHENWEGMTPVGGTTARHCDSCEKNVVDFTGFTDAQLHAYSREAGAKICGRFRPDQLGRPLRAAHKPSYFPLKVAATAAGMLLSSATTSAQQIKPAQHQTAEVNNHTRKADTLAPTPVLDKVRFPEPEIMGEMAPFPFPEPADTSISTTPIECGLTEPDTVEVFTLKSGLNNQVIKETYSQGKLLSSVVEDILPYPPALVNTNGEVTEVITGDEEVRELPEKSETITNCQSRSASPITSGQIKHLTARNSGQLDVAEARQDSLPHNFNSLKNMPAPSPQPRPTILGRVAIHQPEPTGIDGIIDSLKNMVVPSNSSPESKTLHQRPRPEKPSYLDALGISPNPMVEKLKLKLDVPAATTLKVELIDARGRTILQQQWLVYPGDNKLVLRPQITSRNTILFVRISDTDGGNVVKQVLISR